MMMAFVYGLASFFCFLFCLTKKNPFWKSHGIARTFAWESCSRILFHIIFGMSFFSIPILFWCVPPHFHIFVCLEIAEYLNVCVCVWESRIAYMNPTMKYNMFTTIYFIFRLNDTTTTCATAIVSQLENYETHKVREWLSTNVTNETHKHTSNSAFFSFSFPFISFPLQLL